MALSWKGMIVAMLAGGAIGVFLSPVVRPAIARNARPALKAAMQAGLSLYERGREATAELGEMVEDIAAELKAERNGARSYAKNAETAVAAHLSGGARP
jgi:hypothetical protein